MKTYPDTYTCIKCGKLNHKYLRCLCWAKDDSDWPHKDKHYDYSFVLVCSITVQWLGDFSGMGQYGFPAHGIHRDSEDDWGYRIDYIPEVNLMEQSDPFSYTIWTPSGIAYNLRHAIRLGCPGTEEPHWERYHVFSCGNIDSECDCCCGDPLEEEEFHSAEDMEEMQREYRRKLEKRKETNPK